MVSHWSFAKEGCLAYFSKSQAYSLQYIKHLCVIKCVHILAVKYVIEITYSDFQTKAI